MSEYARRISVMAEEVRNLKVLTESLVSPDIISFAGGAPAKEAYPFEVIGDIAKEVFQPDARGFGSVVYGTTMGVVSLREAVRDILLKPRGLEVDIDNIMITAGGIQPINMLCQLFIDPGDTILVETPTFVHTSMIYKMFQANLVPCEMDDDGLVIADVEEKIKKYHPKMIYTVPTFQNPTGVTLAQERRKQLAGLGSRYDVIILEDDPYREIRYSGEELIPIKAFDQTGNTVFAGSFSKIFAPGSRLGFIAASDEIMEKLCNIKLGTDTCTNTMTQTIAGEFFKRGYYPQHLANLQNLYRIRRDAMVKALDAYFPEGTKHTDPDGGYYVWVELPKELDTGKLAPEVAEKLNVCYGDGSIFFSEGNPQGAGSNCMRMNFSGQTEEVITKKLAELGNFFKEKLKQGGTSC